MEVKEVLGYLLGRLGRAVLWELRHFKPHHFARNFATVAFVFMTAWMPRKVVRAHLSRREIFGSWDVAHHSAIRRQPAFRRTVEELRLSPDPPALLILNRHALNVTQSWLCNTQAMPGVHRRLLVVVLDAESERALQEDWPQLRLLRFRFPALEDVRFAYGEPKYQLFLFFRTNLATALLQEGLGFWMVQADTFWRRDLFGEVPGELTSAPLVFDRAGEAGLQGQAVAGGYWRVRPGARSRALFRRLSWALAFWYCPDNAVYTVACGLPSFVRAGLRCDLLPYGLVATWRWLEEAQSKEGPGRLRTPALLQFDGDSGGAGGKAGLMHSHGLYFRSHRLGQRCDGAAVAKALRRTVWQTSEPRKASWKERQLKFYIAVSEVFFSLPLVGEPARLFLLSFAYYFMLFM